MSAADTGFMLICAALVLFMTPGLAFFYGGLGRRKNVVNNIFASVCTIGLETVLWVVAGFSLAFGQDHGGIIGGLEYVMMNGVGAAKAGPYAPSIPFLAYALFQMMFAIITPALVTGAVAGRMRFKSLVLFGIRGTAAYAYHARVLGKHDEIVDAFFVEALAALAEVGSIDSLLPLVLKVGEINLACMAMLDAANTGAFGTPEPTTVTLEVEPGPFIVVTGHDLYDLKLLLEQTEGKGVNVYTHSEMLPAHAYPELKKYSHLKGNFGTAWQNQRREFDNIPGALLYTTNCLMPPKDSYSDRVFTTEMVSFPNCTHIGVDKDFTPVIEKALELGGFAETQRMTGVNGGTTVTTGFARDAVLSVADTVIDAVKAGAIKHFFLVAGCDGARPGRNYYTDFVKATPADTVVLTLACGKYRFNDLDLGQIGGLPRLMDMGQCNDAYSAIQVAVALADAFGCGVNDLPLSMVLSWYEQKAVCILLTLLHLGIKGIKLGPTLPAFVSPNVLNVLVENYGIAPISTPEADLAELLG